VDEALAARNGRGEARGLGPASFPGLHEALSGQQVEELVQLLVGETGAEALLESGVEVDSALRTVKLREQKVRFLAQVKILTRARILDDVSALRAEGPHDQIRPAGRKYERRHGAAPRRLLAASRLSLATTLAIAHFLALRVGVAGGRDALLQLDDTQPVRALILADLDGLHIRTGFTQHGHTPHKRDRNVTHLQQAPNPRKRDGQTLPRPMEIPCPALERARAA